MKTNAFRLYATVATLLASTGSAFAGDLTANVGAASNYLWRGLTQSENGAAVSGGIDYTADNGFYIGTWASNVSYVPADAFSFEHDLYLGFRGGENVTWDVGYLYYNYDTGANYDFSEVYAALGYKGFTLKYSALAHSGRSEGLDTGTRGVGPDVNYSFGAASYLSLDYTHTLPNEITLGFHIGTHQGDFARSFNAFTTGSYMDYNVSLSKGGFKFVISDTNLGVNDQYGSCSGACGGFGPDAFTILPNTNGEPKFVVSYSMAVDL